MSKLKWFHFLSTLLHFKSWLSCSALYFLLLSQEGLQIRHASKTIVWRNMVFGLYQQTFTSASSLARAKNEKRLVHTAHAFNLPKMFQIIPCHVTSEFGLNIVNLPGKWCVMKVWIFSKRFFVLFSEFSMVLQTFKLSACTSRRWDSVSRHLSTLYQNAYPWC